MKSDQALCNCLDKAGNPIFPGSISADLSIRVKNIINLISRYTDNGAIIGVFSFIALSTRSNG